MNWEIRAKSGIPAYLEFSAPSETRAPRNLDFTPAASRTGMPVKVKVPGVANVKIDAIYRVLSSGKSTTNLAMGFCTLDDKGECTVTAPAVRQTGAMVVDWIRRPNERWIFTSGVLTLVE
jgi:hypothetical protein